MNAYIALLLLTAIAPASLEEWSLMPREFFTEESPITNFIEEQSDRVKKFVISSYKSVENYNVDELEEDFVKSEWKTADVDPEIGSMLEHPDVMLTVPAIIARNGYNCETHTVISQGYILNIHRIPHSPNRYVAPKRTVLLQHGLFASSADWILNGPEKSLAYVLSDAGYDVWMANIRGNRYSKEHAWLKIDSKTYWDFSWHDVAKHDIPAVIDYILNTKGDGTKITYIGHSMGTTILFAMLTTRPEYNQILTAGFALAPVVLLSDIKSPIKALAPVAGGLATLDALRGSYEFIPKTSVLGKLYGSCDTDGVDSLICKNIAFYICGYNEKQFNKTLLPVFLAHLGTGTSWKTAVHFSQEIVNGGKFQQFDYGYFSNIVTYGTTSPPEYDLSKVTLPIKLFWSQNDLLSSEKDVRMLHDRLPRKPSMYMISDRKFNHLDYLWAVDAPKLLNNEVLGSLRTAMPI